MKYLKTYLLSIILAVASLGLLVPVSASAYTVPDAVPYLERSDSGNLDSEVLSPVQAEESILHGNDALELIPPRIIYSDLHVSDTSAVQQTSLRLYENPINR